VASEVFENDINRCIFKFVIETKFARSPFLELTEMVVNYKNKQPTVVVWATVQ